MRDRETVSRWAHNPKIGGSTPSPATNRKKNILGIFGYPSEDRGGPPRSIAGFTPSPATNNMANSL